MLLSDPTVTVIPEMLHCHEKQEMAFFQEDLTFHKFTSPNQTVKVCGSLGETRKGQWWGNNTSFGIIIIRC